MKIVKNISLLFAASALFLAGCGDDVSSPGVDNEREVFTTVKLTLISSDKDTVTAAFNDADGEGGIAGSFAGSLKLKAGKTYMSSLTLLDESDPKNIANMGEEVLEEGVDHQVFYTVSTSNLTVEYADKDAKGNPIGLMTTFKAMTAGSGKVQVMLRHQPGVKDGKITSGETYVEVEFPFTVE